MMNTNFTNKQLYKINDLVKYTKYGQEFVLRVYDILCIHSLKQNRIVFQYVLEDAEKIIQKPFDLKKIKYLHIQKLYL